MRDEFAIICLARMIEFTVIGTSGVFILTGGATVIIALTEIWSILETLNPLNPNGPRRSLSKFWKKKGDDYTGIDLDTNDNESIISLSSLLFIDFNTSFFKFDVSSINFWNIL